MFFWQRWAAVRQQRAALREWAAAEGYEYWQSKKDKTAAVSGLASGMHFSLWFNDERKGAFDDLKVNFDIRVVLLDVPFFLRTLRDRQRHWFQAPPDLGEPDFDQHFRAEVGDPDLDLCAFCLAFLPALEAWLQRSGRVELEIAEPEEGENGRALLMDYARGMPEDPQEPIRRAVALLETGRALEDVVIRLS